MIQSTCPPEAEPSDIYIPDPLCAFNVAQVVKVILIRKKDDSAARNTLTYANAALQASWDTLFAAADSTKAQITPEISAPTLEPGDVIEYGSGNEVPDGVPIPVGEDPSVFNGIILSAHPATINSLKLWQQEDVGCFFVNQHGQIIADSDDAESPASIYPFNVRALFVGSRAFGGHVEPDKNALRLTLPEGWDENLCIVTPSDFNARYDLVNP